MRIDITIDNKFMMVQSDFPNELVILKREFTRELSDAWIIKKTRPYLNTERCFMNDYGMVPIGLWLELMQACKKYNIYFELSPQMQAYLGQFHLDWDQFKKYVDEMFDGATVPDKDNPGQYKRFAPREYQIKSAYKLLKYRRCCGEISTSAGKTLISFIIFKYLIDMYPRKKILYVVPSVDLATQSADKYQEYEEHLAKHNHNWEIGIMKAGLTKKQKEAVENCNILFGTYQSLCKRPVEFFDPFGSIIIDEGHHTQSPSLKKIISNCANLDFSIAVTGTFPRQETIESMTIQSYVGPVVYKLSADELINEEKSATPIYAVCEVMDWAQESEKQQLYMQRAQKGNPDNKGDVTLGSKLMKQEEQFINNSYTRMKFIGDMAIKTAKNALVLFGDIKGGYGKRLHKYIDENSDKNVYYVDGHTDDEMRKYYKEQCERDETGKTVLVASIGTFGEGIDLCNIWTIFLVNSAKSERLVRQICGRGLRQYPGKDKTILFDFVDDLRYTMDPNNKYYDNYMWKHYKERAKIYKEQNFPMYEQKISFSHSLM